MLIQKATCIFLPESEVTISTGLSSPLLMHIPYLLLWGMLRSVMENSWSLFIKSWFSHLSLHISRHCLDVHATLQSCVNQDSPTRALRSIPNIMRVMMEGDCKVILESNRNSKSILTIHVSQVSELHQLYEVYSFCEQYFVFLEGHILDHSRSISVFF